MRKSRLNGPSHESERRHHATGTRFAAANAPDEIRGLDRRWSEIYTPRLLESLNEHGSPLKMKFILLSTATLLFLSNAVSGETKANRSEKLPVRGLFPESSPVSKMMVAVHTTDLPRSDKVVVFALDLREDLSPRTETPRDGRERFSVKPYDAFAVVLASKELIGKDAEAVASQWRSLSFDRTSSAFCHFPAYGLRFYCRGELVFETSVCWECTNFSLPDVSLREKSSLGADAPYQWWGFKNDRAAKALLTTLRRTVENPTIDATTQRKIEKAK